MEPRTGCVTDAGLKHLAGLGSLAVLNVADSRITAAGVGQLIKLKSLTELVIDENQAMGAELMAMRQSRPRLQIYVMGAGAPEWYGFQP